MLISRRVIKTWHEQSFAGLSAGAEHGIEVSGDEFEPPTGMAGGRDEARRPGGSRAFHVALRVTESTETMNYALCSVRCDCGVADLCTKGAR